MAALRPGRPGDDPAAEALDVAEPGRGRAATAPWTIPPIGWMDILWRTARDAGRHRLGAVAGGITFYLLLATFPALAAFVSVYGLFMTLKSAAAQLERLSSVFPHETVDLIAGQIARLAAQKHEDLSAALAFGILASLWSANAGMRALFDGLNVAYGEVERRSWMRRTLVSYGATVAVLAFLVAVTLLTVAAPVWLHALGFRGLRDGFAVVRWLLVYGMAAGAFILAYRFGPSRTPARWRWLIVGGALAAVAWMAGSIAFSAYLDNFAHFGAAYGSLGAMIGFMLWLWFTVMVVLVGAELNAEIEHQTAIDTTIGPPAPIGARCAAMADGLGETFTLSAGDVRETVAKLADRLAAIGRRAALPAWPWFSSRPRPPGWPAGRPGPRRSGGR